MNPNVVLWIFIAIVMGVVESATVSLVSVWFCVGAIAAAITASITPSIFAQCTVFVIVTTIMLVITRPIAKRLTKVHFTPTNADRIIGMVGIVTKTINPIEGPGLIKVGGQIWSARSENSTIIEKDSLVCVIKITGVHAIVQLKEEEK